MTREAALRSPAVKLHKRNTPGVACRGVVAAAILLLCSGTSYAQSTSVTLQKLADYPLPGDTSRYDYLTFDPTSHRLYIAHLGQGVVHVFDTQTHTLVGTVDDVPG